MPTKSYTQLLLSACIAVFLLFGLFPPLHADSPHASLPDDELVLIDGQGFIHVVDPHTAPYMQPVSFCSPVGGWQQVRLGDVNGDGDEEIVALQGKELRVYDPVVQRGSTPVSWHVRPPEGQWVTVTTGDVDNDGQDEIIAAHTANRGPIVARMVVFDPRAQGDYPVIFQKDLDIPVLEMDTGDVDGDGWDDIVVLGDVRALFYIVQGGTWDTLHYYVELKPWVGLAVGQTHASSPQEEIATIRRVPPYQDSYWLYRWLAGNRLRLLDRMDFYPNMDDVAMFDMNGDGDEEVLFVRHDDTQVPVVVRNPAGYVLPRDIQIFAGPGWKRIAGGDLDGDGWGELVILKERAYRIYTEPEKSDAFTQHVAPYRLSLAVGNLDGPGIPVKPVLRLSANQVTFHYEAYTPVPAQAVRITNEGGDGPISWEARIVEEEATDWLHIQPTSGQTPGTLVLSVMPQGLPSGSYLAHVRVDGIGALESPQFITVTLTVVTPQLEVQPRTVSFEAQKGHPPLNHILAVRNVGPGGSIGWHAMPIEGSEWLSITPTVGTTPAEITVTIDPREMEVGLHMGAIRVEADDPVVRNSPITITVMASIAPPILKVSPQRLYLNLWPQEEYTPPRVSIVQYGVPQGHAIHWVAGVIPSIRGLEARPIAVTETGVRVRTAQGEAFVPNLDWVTLDPWHGVTPAMMVVKVHNERMEPGVYYATVVIDGGPGTQDRFQGVDLTVVIPAQQHYLPVIRR